MSFHENLTGEDIHANTFRSYVDQTARLADTFVAADQDKVVRQIDTNDYFFVIDPLNGTPANRFKISTGGSGTDADAIHDNVAAEINAIALKATPIGPDVLVIEDSADSFNKKKVTVTSISGSGTDPDAVHVNVAAEITGITAKATPAGADTLIIEDSAAGNVKKSTTAAAIAASGPPASHTHVEADITDLDHTDTDAIHDNVSGEIAAVTEKVTPVSGDFLLIEDSAASNVKKRVQVGNLPAGSGTDDDAIHDNVAGEIALITEKTSTVAADLLVIEDSEASDAKKRLQISNIDHDVLTNSGVVVHSVLDAFVPSNTSTGIREGGVLTLNADPAKFDISAGSAWVVNNHSGTPSTFNLITWTDQIGVTVIDLATNDQTSVGLNSSGTFVQQPAFFTSEEFRDIARLGTLGHNSRTQIDIVLTERQMTINPMLEFLTFARVHGPINNFGNVYGPNGANLFIDKSNGETWAPGQNTNDKIPSLTSDSGQISIVFIYFYRDSTQQDGIGAIAPSFQIDPDQWDDGSDVLQSVPNNQYTTQWIFFSSGSEVTGIQFGQKLYSSKDDAVAGIATDPFVFVGSVGFIPTTRARLVVQEGTTDLTVLVDAEFFDAGRFGTQISGGSGGAATTILGLADVLETSFSGQAGLPLLVNPGESGMIFSLLDHTAGISNVGTNTHAEIDTHVDDVANNPHNVTAAQAEAEVAGAVATHDADASAHTGLLDLAGTRAMTGDLDVNGNEIDGGILLGGTLTDLGLFQYLDEIGSVGFYGDPLSPALLVSQATTFDVATGIGSFHTGATIESPLGIGDWPAAASNAIPLNTIRYVGVEWNAATPQVVVKTTNTWTLIQEWPIGVVTRDSDGVHVTIFPPRLTNFSSLIDQRISETDPFARANGLNLGTSSLTVQRTAGRGWLITTPKDFSLFDSNASDNFDRYFDDGGGGFNIQLNQTSFEDVSFDNGTGTLGTLTNNRFGVRWFYMDLQTGGLSMMYGVSNSREVAEAILEEPPTSLPERFQVGTIILGRVVFLKSAGVSLVVDDVWGTTFSSGGGGDGDVIGPEGGVVQDEIPAFTDTSGKSIGGTGVLIGSVTDAIHDNVAGEITAVALKANPVGADVLLIEDSADSNNKKRVTVTSISGSGTDPDAVHVNVDGEIDGVTLKATPVGADLILIEDSAASFAKKKVTVTSISGSGTDPDAVHVNVAAEISGITTKATPAGADLMIIEDSAASNVKKSTTAAAIAASGPPAAHTHVESEITDLDHTDADAIHDNVSGEIIAVTLKAIPLGADVVLIEDTAASNAKKRTTAAAIAASGPPASHTHIEADITDLDHTDVDALHDNVAAEIAGIALKSTPVAADLMVIEDSAASNVKKRVTAGDIAASGPPASHTHIEAEITDLTHIDPDAIHDNVASEISAITTKASPVGADLVLIEDSEAANVKKSTTAAAIAASGPPASHTHVEADITDLDHTDTDAIHDNVAGEILAVTLKATPAGADVVLIEDTAASNVKKRTTSAAIAASGPPASHTHVEADITDLDHTDADAIHDNVSGEIAAVAAKATPVGADFLLIEDSAASNAKKSATITNIVAGAPPQSHTHVEADITDLTHLDPNAIHDNVSAEISVITEKVSPVGADLILIEDSAASNVKKRVQISNLPTGSDADAIHDNVAGEILAVTLKASPAGADVFLLEDTAAANVKKRTTSAAIAASGPPAAHTHAEFLEHDGSVAVTGDMDWDGFKIENVKNATLDALFDHGTVTGNITFDPYTNSAMQKVTVDAAITITLVSTTGLKPKMGARLTVIQGSTGGVVTLSNALTSGGTAITFTVGAGARDVLTLSTEGSATGWDVAVILDSK